MLGVCLFVSLSVFCFVFVVAAVSFASFAVAVAVAVVCVLVILMPIFYDGSDGNATGKVSQEHAFYTFTHPTSKVKQISDIKQNVTGLFSPPLSLSLSVSSIPPSENFDIIITYNVSASP